MADILKDLQEVVLRRRDEREEGSYTAYLFDKGLDKTLKKLGEECAETIIASKNMERSALCEAAGGADCAASGPGAEQGGGASGENAARAREELVGEIGDLLYHLVVAMAQTGISVAEVEALLSARTQKQGNLKKPHVIVAE